jgi:hypothetical protein
MSQVERAPNKSNFPKLMSWIATEFRAFRHIRVSWRTRHKRLEACRRRVCTRLIVTQVNRTFAIRRR